MPRLKGRALIKPMIKWLGTLFERLFGIAGAVALSQAPLFVTQYTHQMAGRVAELNAHVASMRQVALQGGKTLEVFILKFVTNPDPDFHAQGVLMQAMVQRWHTLSEGLYSLQHASLWERPFIFLKHLDSGVAHDTLRAFEPGLPLTLEGGLYACAGLLLATGLFRLLRAALYSLSLSQERTAGWMKKREYKLPLVN